MNPSAIMIRSGEWIESNCHRIYALIALPTVLLLVFLVPPFQAPDEFAHFHRAEHVSLGNIGGLREGKSSGGNVDPAARKAMDPFRDLPGRTTNTLDLEALAQARAIQWSGTTVFAGFPNTVNYGPLFYLPQAAGIWLGKRTGLGVIDSLYLARVLNGAAAVLLSLLALRLCVRGRALMFSVLLLPMTLFLYASAAHDALLISTSMLAVAIVSRAVSDARAASAPEYFAFLALVAGAAMGRATHLAFFLLLPLLGLRRMRVLGAIAALALPLAWMAFAGHATMVPMLPQDNVFPDQQLAGLLERPVFGLFVLVHSAGTFSWGEWRSFIGILGWLDTPLPESFYLAATVVLAFAALERRPGEAAGGQRAAWWASASMAGVVVLTFGALYVTWTPVGATEVRGIQGRYFLPCAPLLCWLVPRKLAVSAPSPRAELWLVALALVAATLVVMPGAILRRYYVVP